MTQVAPEDQVCPHCGMTDHVVSAYDFVQREQKRRGSLPLTVVMGHDHVPEQVYIPTENDAASPVVLALTPSLPTIHLEKPTSIRDRRFYLQLGCVLGVIMVLGAAEHYPVVALIGLALCTVCACALGDLLVRRSAYERRYQDSLDRNAQHTAEAEAEWLRRMQIWRSRVYFCISCNRIWLSASDSPLTFQPHELQMLIDSI